MAISALQAANLFIEKSLENGKPLTHMQLQKLVYFFHGWSLTLLNKPAVEDRVEAWTHGPVFPDLYQELKHNGDAPIERQAFVYKSKDIAEDEKEILNDVYETFSEYSGIELSIITHETDTPWFKVFIRQKNFGGVIEDDLTKRYFDKVYYENSQESQNEQLGAA